MHDEIVEKIKQLRLEKGFSKPDMADKLHIDLSAYARLESGKTHSWAKYLEELLIIFETSPAIFFKGIGSDLTIPDKKDSFDENIHVENLYAENKDKTQKIEQLYEARLKDKDILIEQLQKITEKLT